MKISIIIVTFQRTSWLERCIRSILENDCLSLYEIVVVINGVDNNTTNMILSLQNSNSFIKFISTNSVTPAEARNMALDNVSNTDYTVFFDDDVMLPKDYFSRFISVLSEHTYIEVLGGPDRAMPDISGMAEVFDLSIQSPLCTGHTCFRHNSYSSELVKASESRLILCHMWFKTYIFKDNEIRFDQRFYRNEENVLLLQLSRDGVDIYYKGDLFIYHRRKKNLLKIFRAYHSSGKSRIETYIYYFSFAAPIYTLPLILLFISMFSIVFPTKLGVITICLYVMISLLESIYLSLNKKRFSLIIPSFALKTFIVFSYALGQLQALIMIPLTIINHVRGNKREVQPLRINS